MTDKTKGNVLVAIQFSLIAVILLMASDEVNVPWIYVGGVLFIAPGIIILVISFKNLGRSLTANPVPLDKGKLVETGIYKYVRHPIYTGLLLAMLGSVVQSMAIVKFFVWLALLALLTYKAKFEEGLLAKKYPGYVEYMKRTGRFVPRFLR
jgi:protein-S-isoprenylcysteine O-methyltransferase Ste14